MAGHCTLKSCELHWWVRAAHCTPGCPRQLHRCVWSTHQCLWQAGTQWAATPTILAFTRKSPAMDLQHAPGRICCCSRLCCCSRRVVFGIALYRCSRRKVLSVDLGCCSRSVEGLLALHVALRPRTLQSSRSTSRGPSNRGRVVLRDTPFSALAARVIQGYRAILQGP